jgi:cytochrome c peroxidase
MALFLLANKMKYLIFTITCFLIFLLSECTTFSKSKSVSEKIQIKTTETIDTLISNLYTLKNNIKKNEKIEIIKANFLNNRITYKSIEPIIEYQFQGLTKRINGPALPDIKTEDGQVLPPHGYQVIEQYIWTDLNDSTKSELMNEIELLITDLKFVKSNLLVMETTSSKLMEAIQHQLIRITTLGITGFDSPIAFNSLKEAKASLIGILEFSKILGNNKEIDLQINSAISYLNKNSNFDSFDRMNFIKSHLIPISEAINLLSNSKIVDQDTIKTLKPFSGGLKEFFSGKFDSNYFTPYAISYSNPIKIKLGEKLFYDTNLSKTQKISCATCHKPELAFTDGKKIASDFVHGGKLKRNTPSVMYAGLQNSQFYDMRSIYLEDQIEQVMKNPGEFNLTAETIKNRLLNNKEIKKLFSEAFPDQDSISNYMIRNVISSYIRSLSPFKSKFDQQIASSKNIFDEAEINGFNIFSGKAKCATCHFIPIFNGTIPPWLNKSESEIIGVPQKAEWKNAKIDPDKGRYEINKLDALMFAFKTPTVRNIEKTAPYMHNGVYNTLEEVIKFYHLGGGKGIGIDLESQSLPFDSLSLTEKEKIDLKKFLLTLTDQ